ncbi:hypothetical protein IWX63_001206 [Arthrobacter sp. CAN_A2]
MVDGRSCRARVNAAARRTAPLRRRNETARDARGPRPTAASVPGPVLQTVAAGRQPTPTTTRLGTRIPSTGHLGRPRNPSPVAQQIGVPSGPDSGPCGHFPADCRHRPCPDPSGPRVVDPDGHADHPGRLVPVARSGGPNHVCPIAPSRPVDRPGGVLCCPTPGCRHHSKLGHRFRRDRRSPRDRRSRCAASSSGRPGRPTSSPRSDGVRTDPTLPDYHPLPHPTGGGFRLVRRWAPAQSWQRGPLIKFRHLYRRVSILLWVLPLYGTTKQPAQLHRDPRIGPL